jgi:hypothetical protein
MISMLAAIAVIFIVILAFNMLWSPPKKHKSFSLRDRDEATSRALGGSAPPDASQVKPNVTRKMRKRR